MMYQKMLEKEGKRCWTMQYDEFHIDILPCVPKDEIFKEPTDTAIILTHKADDGKYEPRSSNPYAYHMWFEDRMKEVLLLEKREFASMNKTEISKVPTYKMRTPLQKVVQLLKRHRDICFQSDSENAPISIIITTLAAWSYSGETNIYEALCNVLKKMPQYIECRSSEYWIANPVMNDENFADKWNTEPQKREAFTKWLSKAQKELVENPLSCYGIDAVADEYKSCLGGKPVQRALNSLGTETQTARQNQHLFVDGLTGGLTYSPSEKSKSVKEHTFFGE